MSREPDREQHVEATFEDEAQAREAADRAAGEVGSDASVTIDEPQDRRAALRAEMRDEVESSVVGPGPIGPFTKSMTKGIVVAVPAGAAIGAVIGLLLGLIPWRLGLSLGLRLVLGAAIGLAAGATVGFVIGGFVKSRVDREGDQLDSERGVTVGVHTKRSTTADRAEAVMDDEGAQRVERMGRGGRPQGPSSEEKQRPVRGS